MKMATILSALMFGFIAATAFAADKGKPLTVTFTNELKDGKKTWVPSTTTLPPGADVEFKVVNPLTDPHGFEIQGLVTAQVINAGETKTIKVDKIKGGTYAFKCQLHPAHVGGELSVK